MAHFRAESQGTCGGIASRLGTKSSGITTIAQSWEGAVRVDLYYDEKNDRDMARVSLIKHRGQGTETVLWTGPVSGMEEIKLIRRTDGKV